MKKYLLFVLFLIAVLQHVSAQDEKKAVKEVINRFFDGLEKGDTALLKDACASTMILQTYAANKEGKFEVSTEAFSDLIAFVATPKKDKYDERIIFKVINIEQSLASVWTPYSFFINDKRSHCGTNSFQLIKTDQGWKIQYIIDTRRKDCK